LVKDTTEVKEAVETEAVEVAQVDWEAMMELEELDLRIRLLELLYITQVAEVDALTDKRQVWAEAVSVEMESEAMERRQKQPQGQRIQEAVEAEENAPAQVSVVQELMVLS
jgi:hypothetical protein